MSQSMEFKELTKKDAQISLAHELENLKRAGNLPALQAQMIDKEFDGFQRLYGKFLAADVEAPIEWDKIEKLPLDSVSCSYLLIAHACIMQCNVSFM
jgi:UDP-N-acetylglucosamine pyrophosphorylase